MMNRISKFHRSKGKPGTSPLGKTDRQRGIALFITLMLLSLVSLLGLAMMLSVNSDMLINGYYGNYRSSFYSADSGLSVVRQAMANSFQAAVTATACPGWGSGGPSGCTSTPLTITDPSTVKSSLATTYGASFQNINSSGSWPGSFQMVDTTSCTNSIGTWNGTAWTIPAPTTAAAKSPYQTLVGSYTYNIPYQLCVTGRAQSAQQALVKESGSMVFTITANTVPSGNVPTSFSAFGIFIDHQGACNAPLVPGTITGPAFTNGSWNWGNSGSYIYTDPVGQATGNNPSFWFGGSCVNNVNKCNASKSGSTISPTFQQGCNLNQQAITLPGNDFSQKWAVLDGVGCGEGGTTCGVSTPGTPSNTDMAAHLTDTSGKAYGSSGAGSNGNVFLPYCASSCPTGVTPNTINGGGIYVNGDASVTLTPGTDSTSAHNQTQIYSIVSGGVTTTITTNITLNQTTVKVGSGSTQTLTGVPMNYGSSPASPATLLYVNGTVTGLTGPGQGLAAIQDHSQVSVVASGSINITGDLIYAHEPVTENTSDTLISGNNYNQVLGIFTTNGDIILNSPYSNGNLETDASLAAINSSCTSSSSNSVCGIATTGSNSSCGGGVSAQICTWTTVGGRIESNAHPVSIHQANTYFDRRFTSVPGFAPPWFPSTTVPAQDLTQFAAPTSGASFQRFSWVSYPQ